MLPPPELSPPPPEFPPPPELSPPPPELSPPPPVSPPPYPLSDDVGDPPPPQASSKIAVPPTIVSVDAFFMKSLRDGLAACSSKQLQSHFVFFILSVMDKT